MLGGLLSGPAVCCNCKCIQTRVSRDGPTCLSMGVACTLGEAGPSAVWAAPHDWSCCATTTVGAGAWAPARVMPSTLPVLVKASWLAGARSIALCRDVLLCVQMWQAWWMPTALAEQHTSQVEAFWVAAIAIRASVRDVVFGCFVGAVVRTCVRLDVAFWMWEEHILASACGRGACTWVSCCCCGFAWPRAVLPAPAFPCL